MSQGFPRWSQRRFVQGACALASMIYLPLATAVLFERSLPHAGSGIAPGALSPAALLWPGLILLIGGSIGAFVSRHRREMAQAAWIGERRVPHGLQGLGLAADVLLGGGCVAGMVLIVTAMQGPGTARLTLPIVGGAAALFLAVGAAAFLEARIVAACVDSPATRLRLRWAGTWLAVVSGLTMVAVGVFGLPSPEWLRLAVVPGALALMAWIVVLADRSTRRQR
jgi:hypothetical protein